VDVLDKSEDRVAKVLRIGKDALEVRFDHEPGEWMRAYSERGEHSSDMILGREPLHVTLAGQFARVA